MVLSYPDIYCDIIDGKPLDRNASAVLSGIAQTPALRLVQDATPRQYYKWVGAAAQNILKNK